MAKRFKKAAASTKSSTGPVGELAGKIGAIAASLTLISGQCSGGK